MVHHQFGFPEPTARRLPGYPFFLAGLMTLSVETFWLSLCSVILSSVLPIFVYLLGLRLFEKKKIALASSVMAILNPTFLFLSPVIASEHLFVLLVTGALILAVSRARAGRSGAVLTGILAGAAIMVRGEGIILLVVLPMLWWMESRSLATVLKKTAVVAAAVGVIIAPWAVRNSMIFGSPVGLASTAGLNFYYGHNPVQYGYHDLNDTAFETADEGDRSREAVGLSLDRLVRRPWTLVSDVVQGTWELYRPTRYALFYSLQEHRPYSQLAEKRKFTWVTLVTVSVGFYFFLLILSGVAVVKRVIGSRAAAIMSLIVGANWLFYAVLFFAQPRFRYLTEVMLCLAAGAAFFWLQNRGQKPVEGS